VNIAAGLFGNVYIYYSDIKGVLKYLLKILNRPMLVEVLNYKYTKAL